MYDTRNTRYSSYTDKHKHTNKQQTSTPRSASRFEGGESGGEDALRVIILAIINLYIYFFLSLFLFYVLFDFG